MTSDEVTTIGDDSPKVRAIRILRPARPEVNPRGPSWKCANSASATRPFSNCDLKLLGLSSRARRVLTIAGLLTVLEVFESEDEAVRSFTTTAPPLHATVA